MRSRILLSVHSANLGGGERMALAEAEYLTRIYDLTISVADGPLRPLFARHGEIIEATTSMPIWSNSVRRWLGRSGRTVSEAIRLARVIRQKDIQLVLTSSSTAVAPALAARLAHVPAIVHARDVPVSRFAPLLFKLDGALAQTVIVISSGLEPYFSTRNGARIKKIPDGIELPTPSVGEGRSRASGMDHQVRLCVVGGVASRKGQDIAVEALGRLSGSGVDARLDLVGREIDPHFVASVRRRAEELGVADRVSFVGELDDVHGHLRDIDIVLAPSRGEWTPLALMEAMAQRKPVVAASVGGVADIVNDGDTGVLIPPEDPEALASAILRLIKDPSNTARMALRGRQSVQTGFDIKLTLERLDHEIRRLLAGPQSSATISDNVDGPDRVGSVAGSGAG